MPKAYASHPIVFPTSLRSTAQRPMDVGFGKGQTSTLNFRHRMTSSSRWVSSAVQRWVSTGTVRWTRPMRPAERLLRPCSSEYVSLVLQCAGKFAQHLPMPTSPAISRSGRLTLFSARTGGLLPRLQRRIASACRWRCSGVQLRAAIGASFLSCAGTFVTI